MILTTMLRGNDTQTLTVKFIHLATEVFSDVISVHQDSGHYTVSDSSLQWKLGGAPTHGSMYGRFTAVEQVYLAVQIMRG